MVSPRKKSRCPKGYIRRVAYVRSPYRRQKHIRKSRRKTCKKNGVCITKVYKITIPSTRVHKTRVASRCIRSPTGKSYKTSHLRRVSKGKKKQGWIAKEGKLGGGGYLHKSQSERHAILNKCVKQYGYRSCLGSIMVLERSTKLREMYGQKLSKDRQYLVNKYGGKGAFGKRKSVKRKKSKKRSKKGSKKHKY